MTSSPSIADRVERRQKGRERRRLRPVPSPRPSPGSLGRHRLLLMSARIHWGSLQEPLIKRSCLFAGRAATVAAAEEDKYGRALTSAAVQAEMRLSSSSKVFPRDTGCRCGHRGSIKTDLTGSRLPESICTAMTAAGLLLRMNHSCGVMQHNN